MVDSVGVVELVQIRRTSHPKVGDRMHVKRPRPVVRVEGVVVLQMVVCIVTVPYCRVEVFAAV